MLKILILLRSTHMKIVRLFFFSVLCLNVSQAEAAWWGFSEDEKKSNQGQVTTLFSKKSRYRGIADVHIQTASGKQVGLYDESYALVLGVSNYTAGWSDLPGVLADIKAVCHVLQEQGFHDGCAPIGGSMMMGRRIMPSVAKGAPTG